MNKSGTVLMSIASLLISPMAIAEIYKCDGPDGPIFTDRKCGPNAASVELVETSGVSGVSDETKADLARKKAERADARENSSSPSASTNYQFNTTSEPAGRWVRPYRTPGERPVNLPERGERPVTLPATVQRPASGVTVKRRQ